MLTLLRLPPPLLLLLLLAGLPLGSATGVRSPPISASRTASAVSVQSLMVGVFSNEEQAARDAREGRPTAALGGHEHVTACIAPHPNKALPKVLLARYYLGTDPTRTFRLRCYEFCEPSADGEPARMRLYRPLPATEAVFKSAKYDPTHPTVLALPSSSLPFGGQLRKLSADQLLQRDFEYLSGCDVLWHYRQPTFPFTSRPLPGPFPRYFQGTLAEGSCSICSQTDPNLRLVAKDDLRLSDRRLDINDRVYTVEGKLVIGSASGEPYRMLRQ